MQFPGFRLRLWATCFGAVLPDPKGTAFTGAAPRSTKVCPTAGDNPAAADDASDAGTDGSDGSDIGGEGGLIQTNLQFYASDAMMKFPEIFKPFIAKM